MNQTQDTYTPPDAYIFHQNPSAALAVTPKALRRYGKDKSEEWHDGANAALFMVRIGLQKDGILPSLLMQNQIAELAQEKRELEAKLAASRAKEAEYRQKLIGSYTETEQAA